MLPLVAAMALLAGAVVRRHDEVGAAFASAPLSALAVLAALHLCTLVLRTEAWRLVLNAGSAVTLRRRHVHGASAGAYAAGTAVIYCAMPVRVALLRRLAGPAAPRIEQILVADVPILMLEVGAAGLAVAVAATGAAVAPWWVAVIVAAGAGGVLAALRYAHRRAPQGRLARGVAVLGDRTRRGPLVALVVAISVLFTVRAWVVLLAFGLSHSLADACALFALLGAFGLLPVGPSSSSAATIALFGVGAFDDAAAAGLAISATTFVAVAAYALLAAGAVRVKGLNAGFTPPGGSPSVRVPIGPAGRQSWKRRPSTLRNSGPASGSNGTSLRRAGASGRS